MTGRKILALDLATEFGFAVWRDGRIATSGAIKLPSEERGRLSAFAEELTDLLAVSGVAWGGGEVAIEGEVSRYADAHRVACQLQARLFDLADLFGVERVDRVPPKALKKWAAGSGNATKGDMVEAVRDRWAPNVVDHNEADAIALAFYQLETGRGEL